MTPLIKTEDFEKWLENQKNYFLEKVDYYSAKSHAVAAYEAQLIARTFSDVLDKYRTILPPPTTLN